MTTFPRISTTKLGRNKNVPRIWLEGRYLLDAGFQPTNRIEVEIKTGQVTIRLTENGSRVVSSKRHGQIPILDLNSADLAKAFGSITTLQVYICAGEIILTPSQTEVLRTTRCRNGKEGSIYSGAGLLSEAARLAGYQPMAGQGTGAVVAHKTLPSTWRWLTLNELRKLHRDRRAFGIRLSLA